MDSDNNVIDLSARLRGENAEKEQENSDQSSASVTDISRIRGEVIAEERRKVKRTILTEFIGASVVVPNLGLKKVTLHDVSEGGIAFDIEDTGGRFEAGEEVAVRVYMNYQTYFPFTVKVNHVAHQPELGIFRHGTSFVKDSVNEEAIFHFVKFIETVSAALKSDRGDVMVSNIK